MYLLLEKNANNTIISIIEAYQITDEEKSIYVPMENTYYCADAINIIEIEHVPDYILAGKYCYSKDKGFYENPNYRVPSGEVAEKIHQEISQLRFENTELSEALLDTQIALTEQYEEILKYREELANIQKALHELL